MEDSTEPAPRLERGAAIGDISTLCTTAQSGPETGYGRLHHASGSTALGVTSAASFWGRFKGLMFTPGMPQDHGFLLVRCASVHTCWMRYPIDVVYLDSHGRATRLVQGLRPWRVSIGDAHAVHALELDAGGIRHLGIGVGDRLEHPALTRKGRA